MDRKADALSEAIEQLEHGAKHESWSTPLTAEQCRAVLAELARTEEWRVWELEQAHLKELLP